MTIQIINSTNPTAWYSHLVGHVFHDATYDVNDKAFTVYHHPAGWSGQIRLGDAVVVGDIDLVQSLNSQGYNIMPKEPVQADSKLVFKFIR